MLTLEGQKKLTYFITDKNIPWTFLIKEKKMLALSQNDSLTQSTCNITPEVNVEDCQRKGWYFRLNTINARSIDIYIISKGTQRKHIY